MSDITQKEIDFVLKYCSLRMAGFYSLPKTRRSICAMRT